MGKKSSKCCKKYKSGKACSKCPKRKHLARAMPFALT